MYRSSYLLPQHVATQMEPLRGYAAFHVTIITPPRAAPVPPMRAVTPEGFHLHSPTLPAEARRRATWGYPDPHMTTPAGLHLGRAAKWNPSGVRAAPFV